jgi:hypothetical protein
MTIRPVQRQWDPNAGGGLGTQGHSNITVNRRLMMKYMTPVTPHWCCPLCGLIPACCPHCYARAAFPGSISVTANGVPVLRDFDIDTCGHPRVRGSHNVVCGG